MTQRWLHFNVNPHKQSPWHYSNPSDVCQTDNQWKRQECQWLPTAGNSVLRATGQRWKQGVGTVAKIKRWISEITKRRWILSAWKSGLFSYIVQRYSIHTNKMNFCGGRSAITVQRLPPFLDGIFKKNVRSIKTSWHQMATYSAIVKIKRLIKTKG